MRYTITPFLLIMVGLGFFLTTATARASSQQTFYSSKAYDAATGELVYAEKHRYVENAQGLESAKVEYFTPEGTLLAEKNIDFTISPESPFFVRENKQTGYSEGYEAVSKIQPYQGRLFQRQGGQAPACDDVVDIRPGMIVDAGFNIHLQNNMAALAAGQSLTFDLLIPKACRALEFKASAAPTDKGLLISLKPTSFLARLVVPNTQVLYNAETATLLEYHGLSDLTDAQGRSMKVSIYFEEPVIQQATAGETANQGKIAVHGKQTNTTRTASSGQE